MNKSYINKRGYILVKEHFNENTINKLREELTVKPFVTPGYGTEQESYPIYEENERKIYIPKIFGINKFGKTENRIPYGEDIDLKFNGDLRDNQIEPFEATMKALQTTGGGMLVLPCGFGKTCLGLKLVSEIKKKTLVICHKEFLVSQWRERIEVFLPEARIGKIQGTTFDIEDKDIVIGMLQTISMRDFPLDAFNSFNFLMVDEAHHISSRVFSRALRKLNCNYHIGLSATPVRTDGLMKVLNWHIGDIFYQVNKEENKRSVKIEYIVIDNDPVYSKEILNYKRRPQIPSMITNIIKYEKRTIIIIEKILELCKDKRNILVLSDRRDHLVRMSELLEERDYFNWGFYIGGMKELQLKLSENKQVILGTYQMCSEGYDNKNLDTLIMATSKSNIEQSVGRVLRKKVYDVEPLVVDIVDNFSAFKNQARKRKVFYKRSGYM